MEHLLNFLILPTLYRVAGSDLKIPSKKLLRRAGIPLFLGLEGLLLGFSLIPLLITLSVMSAVLCFNLDEIEEKDWDDVFCYGFALSFALWPLGGIYSGLVGLWWFVGVLLSNGVLGAENGNGGYPKLDWKWVEVGMGIAMAGAIWLNSFFG